MNHFMRAHGYLPGPTQRPVAAGLLCGVVAVAPSLALGWYAGTLAAGANAVGMRSELGAIVVAALAATAGGLYGRVFMRAANDRRGGWLFGMGFGFLLWMLGPGTVAHWIRGSPLVIGRTAQTLLALHLLYGLVLGLAFPRVHALVERGAGIGPGDGLPRAG